ncbi:unnamed protein product [Strongylus vulgaris]|uniref:Uncharacterized protein n=1 Tax=Strongylus vulgaris TaxID=40348 RepID=A0A3P7JMZ3_STRVU|nr:unnamed protein product [Strongylus vulgaris]
MACLQSSCRLQHCLHPFLSLANVIHDIGIGLRRLAENSAGSVQRTRPPIWLGFIECPLYAGENNLLKELVTHSQRAWTVVPKILPIAFLRKEYCSGGSPLVGDDFFFKIIADTRALTVQGINQEGSSSGQFMKLFKSETKEKPKKAKSSETDDEDDDTLEEEQADNAVVEYEPAWLRLTNSFNDEKQHRPLKATSSSGSGTQEKPILAAGLRFAKNIYGIDKFGPSPETRAFYKSYVNAGGYKFDAAVCTCE